MYRLAPSRCARRPKHPANRSRNLPSRSSTARADDTDKFTEHQRTRHVTKSTVRNIGSSVRAIESAQKMCPNPASGGGSKCDAVPQLFELAYVTPRIAFPMPLLEVIRTEFFVRRLAREDVIRNRQDLMRDSDDRPLVPAAPLDPLIEGGEGGRFRPTGGGGGFNERHAQGGIAMPSTGDAPL